MNTGKKSRYQRLAALAEDQDNVVARAQVLKAGWTDKQVELMLRKQHWLQLQRGVYLLSPGPATWRQLARGAHLAAGAGVALDAGSALLWWGVEGPTEGDIELALVNRRGRPSPTGTLLRQPSRALTTRVREGVLVVCIEELPRARPF